jgi:hypothetical protein
MIGAALYVLLKLRQDETLRSLKRYIIFSSLPQIDRVSAATIAGHHLPVAERGTNKVAR